MEVSTDTDVGSFPAAPRFPAVIPDVSSIGSRAVCKGRDHLFQTRRVTLEAMRTENGHLDIVTARA